MQQHARNLIHLFGFVAWGDFGPLTIYTSARHRVVAYPRAPPTSPPTPWQTSQRARFSAAAAAWKIFVPSLKPNWEKAARRLSLKVTGYDLFVYYHLSQDRLAIATVERQSKLQLLPLAAPSSSSSSSSSSM